MTLWSSLALALVLSLSLTLPAYATVGGDIVSQLRDANTGQQVPAAMTVDSNGNVIIAGYQNLSGGNNDKFYVIKVNTSVNCGEALPPCVAWSATFNSGATPSGADRINALAVDSNNDVIVAGYVWNGNNNDCKVIKYSGADGTQTALNYSYNGGVNGADYCASIAVDDSNNIYVGGYTATSGRGDDFLILKFLAGQSTPTWTVTYDAPRCSNDNSKACTEDADCLSPGTCTGNGADNRLTSLALTSDGLVTTGYSWNGTDFDYLTVKFDTNGVKQWAKRYTSSGVGDDKPSVIKADALGNVVVTGYVSNATDHDIYTVKYNGSTGAWMWDRTYNGGFADDPSAMWLDSASDVYISGTSWTLAGRKEVCTIRYSGAAGEPVWEKVMGTGGDNDDVTVPTGIVTDSSGDVLVTGFVYKAALGNYDWLTVKFNGSNGNFLWQTTFDGAQHKDDQPVGLALSSAGDLYVAGYSDNWTGGSPDLDYYVIKYDRGLLNPPTGLTATAGVCSNDSTRTCTSDVGCVSGGTCAATSIRLVWAENSSNETDFRVERKRGAFGSWGEITTIPYPLPADSTAYTDTGLDPNNYYFYRVRAHNATDWSNYSNEAHALTKIVTYDPPSWTYLYNGQRGCSNDPVRICTADSDCAPPGICSSGADIAFGIAAGADDNPVVTGYVTSARGDADYYTVKLNRADKSVIWSDTYNDFDDEQDAAMCIAADSQGNVIVSGYSSLWSTIMGQNTNHIYTIKYDGVSGPSTPGEGVWNVQYNSPFQVDDETTAVATTVDGSNNIVVVGYGRNAPGGSGNNDILVVEYLSSGVQDWSATPYDGPGHGDDYPTSAAFDKDGNVFVTGYIYNGPTNHDDIFTAKYCGSSTAPCGGYAKGQRIWTDIYNGAGNGNDHAVSLAVDKYGDVYVTGFSVNASGNEDWVTIKYRGKNVLGGDENRIAWQKTYDGPAHGNDEARTVKVDPIDGAVVVAGTSLTAAGNNDFHMIRYNALDGSVVVRSDGTQWEENFERPDNDDHVTAMEMDSSGYIYVTGDTNNGSNLDILSIIYDYEGTFLGAMTFNGIANNYDSSTAVAVNYQGEAFITGYSTNANGNEDYVVLKQKNNYMLAPAPFTATADPDYHKVNLSWRENTSGTGFHIERAPAVLQGLTACPPSGDSSWALVYTASSGTLAWQDSGLSEDANYCYRIEAFVGTLMSRKPVASVTTTLRAPTLNSPSNMTTNSIYLSWDSVTGPAASGPPGQNGTPAGSYTLQYKPAGGSWTDVTLPTNCAGIAATNCTPSGLSAGIQYYFRVKDTGPAGDSSWSNEVNAYTVPSAPTLNNPSNIQTDRMTLSWSSVTGAASYTLQYKPSGGSYADVSNCAGITVTTCTASGLTPNGTQYFFRVKASNASGDSTWSTPEVNGYTTYVVPPTPTLTGVSRATDCSNNNATITWDDVAGETGYYVEYTRCNQSGANPGYCATNSGYWETWQSAGSPSQNATTWTYAMSAGYAYRFRVYSTVNSGNTKSSASNEGSVWACMAALAQTSITPISNTSLMPNWTNIDGNTNYDVQRRDCTGACSGSTCTAYSQDYRTIQGSSGLGANVTSWTDSGLTQGASYAYKIRAYNTTNFSGLVPPPDVWSNEQCLATPPPAPDPLTLSGVTISQIQLSWQNNGSGQYVGYEIQRAQATYINNPENDTTYWGSWTTIAGNRLPDPDFENATTSWTGTVGTLTGVSFDTSVYYSGSKSLKLTATGATLGRYLTVSVTPGAQYVLSGNIRTSLAGSSGRAQCDVSGGTLDSAGIGINALNDTNNDGNWHYLTETVTIPSNVSSVQIRCFADGTPNGTANFDLIVLQTSAMANPNNTTYTDTGLATGYGYKYQVRGLYNGPGLYTGYTTPAYTRTYPTAPAFSTLTANSTTQITVNWGDVSGDVGYNLRYAVRSGSCPAAGDWGTAISLGENTTNKAVTGLTAGTYYCFEIRACRAYSCSSGNGYGAWSTTVRERETLLAAPTLNNPSNFITDSATCVSSPNNSSSMDLSWSYGGTGTPAGYQIQRKTGTGGAYAAIATPSASPYTDSGLKAGEYYCYQVYAKNDEGYYSAASNEKCVRTTPCRPVVTLSVQSPSQITLSWQVVYGATNYRINKKVMPGGTYGQINDLPVAYQELYCNQPYPYVGCTTLSPITTTRADTGLTEGTNFCYQVAAYNTDSMRDSAPSAEQCIYTSDLAKPGLTGSALNSLKTQVNWTYNPAVCAPNPCRSDIDGVEIEFKLSNGLWALMATVNAPGGTSGTVIQKIGINPNTVYSYRARSFKGQNRSQYSDVLSITTPPYASGDGTCD